MLRSLDRRLSPDQGQNALTPLEQVPCDVQDERDSIASESRYAFRVSYALVEKVAQNQLMTLSIVIPVVCSDAQQLYAIFIQWITGPCKSLPRKKGGDVVCLEVQRNKNAQWNASQINENAVPV
jgi:hypothetical protein